MRLLASFPLIALIATGCGGGITTASKTSTSTATSTSTTAAASTTTSTLAASAGTTTNTGTMMSLATAVRVASVTYAVVDTLAAKPAASVMPMFTVRTGIDNAPCGFLSANFTTGTIQADYVNVDGIPTNGDHIDVTHSGCAGGTRGNNYSTLTGKISYDLTGFTGFYSAPASWSANVRASLAALRTEWDSVTSNVASKGSLQWDMVIDTGYVHDGKSTSVTSDDTDSFTMSTSGTVAVTSNTVNDTLAVKANSSCALLSNGQTNCAVIQASINGAVITPGTKSAITLNNSGSVLFPAARAPLGAFKIVADGQTILLSFYSENATPMVRITAPNGLVSTMTVSSFLGTSGTL